MNIKYVIFTVPFHTFRYSQQFRGTVAKHFCQTTNVSHENTNAMIKFFDFAPTFLKDKNYFGKLLGQHFTTVMEVMYHNSLKPGALRPNWQQTFPEMYSFLQQSNDLHYNNTLFALTMTDYLKNDSLPYFMFWHYEKAYSYYYGIPVEMDMSYNGSLRTQFDALNAMKDGTTKESRDKYLNQLKDKYHARQMILTCIGPTGGDCESLFTPVITDKGICYAINAQNASQAMSLEHEYIKVFHKVYGINDSYTKRQPSQNLSADYRFFIILDSHQSGNFGSRIILC